jgi:hypothetical protein
MEFGYHLPSATEQKASVTVNSVVSWLVTPSGMGRCFVGVPHLHEDGVAGSINTSVIFMLDTALHYNEQLFFKQNRVETFSRNNHTDRTNR